MSVSEERTVRMGVPPQLVSVWTKTCRFPTLEPVTCTISSLSDFPISRILTQNRAKVLRIQVVTYSPFVVVDKYIYTTLNTEEP